MLYYKANKERLQLFYLHKFGSSDQRIVSLKKSQSKDGDIVHHSYHKDKGTKTNILERKTTKTYHPKWGTNCLGREIVSEFGSYYSTWSMWSGHLSPDDSNLAWLFITFCNSAFLYSVYVGNSLSKVEVCIFLGINTFYSDQGSVFMLVPQTSLVTQEYSLWVKPLRENKAYGIMKTV